MPGDRIEERIATFREALARGADGIESDLQLTADGVPVVVHDSDLMRVTGTPGMVRTSTAAQLRDLGLPCLEDLLHELPPPALLNLEIKELRITSSGLEAAVRLSDRGPGRWGPTPAGAASRDGHRRYHHRPSPGRPHALARRTRRGGDARMNKFDLAHAQQLDAADPLAHFRTQFAPPPGGGIYMDGNSLGLMPLAARDAVIAAVDEWRDRAIGGWLEADPPWFHSGEELGAALAPLIGAAPDEVVLTGTTTVNLHNLLATFYQPSGRRTRILADELNFPSDIYAMGSHLRLRRRNLDRDLILARSRDGRTLTEEDIISCIDSRVALVVLPSVLYRSGQLLDIARITAAAHERGALIGWDLSHSAGAVPHQLDEADVDFAFFCTYKYLNGGPGAPAALYVNRRHFGLGGGLTGWWGYHKDRQFDMLLDWQPAPNAGAWQISTVSVMATAAVRGAVAITRTSGMEALRRKSLAMTSYLMELADELIPTASYGYRIGTPREPERRGGHVAVEHASEAVRIGKALRARGVIPDFRPPNVIRLAPIPLYTTYADVWHVIHHLREIVEQREYERFPVGRDTVS
jgi:kynureninase